MGLRNDNLTLVPYCVISAVRLFPLLVTCIVYCLYSTLAVLTLIISERCEAMPVSVWTAVTTEMTCHTCRHTAAQQVTTVNVYSTRN